MKTLKTILISCAILCGAASLAVAQEPPKPAAAAAPKADDGFVPVNGDMMQPGEVIPAAKLVATAYGIIFAAVALWVLSVARRASRVADEAEALRRKIAAGSGGRGA